MVATDNLTGIISNAIKQAQNEAVFCQEIYNNSSAQIGKNEFLFFIKPEITQAEDSIQLDKVLELIQDKIETFGLTIHNAKILSAK